MNIYLVAEQVGLEGYWITDILSGIQREALKKNINIMDYTGALPENETSRPIVLVVGYTQNWMENTCAELKKKDIQPILVNADHNIFAEVLGSIGYVSFGFKRAVYDVLKYLISVDRKKIAFFGAHSSSYSEDVKADEFLRLSAIFDLPITKNDLYRGNYIEDCFKSFVKNIKNYNAVFCSSDAAASYIISKCKEINVLVPRDLAVIGFGNTKLSLRLRPTLTTVENNYVELGRQAVKLHQLLQKNTDIDAASILVECPLSIRNSSPPVRNGLNFSPEISKKENVYRADPNFMQVLRAEELLKNWDDIDKQIAAGLSHGKTVISIAEGLFISVSAVKYRIKKMLIYADLKNKAELTKLIKKYNLVD